MVKVIEYSDINCRLSQMNEIKVKKSFEAVAHKLPAPYHRRIPGVLEKDLLKATKAELTCLGIWHRRLEGIGKLISSHSEARLVPGDMKGMPDLLACKGGRLIAIEVKAPGGVVSGEQYACLKSLHEAGAMVMVVVNPQNLGQVFKSLEHCKILIQQIDGWLDVI